MNLFYISSILIFFASLTFGLFVYVNNTKAKLNSSWFLFSSLIAFWGFSLYGVTSAKDVETAMLWQYALDVIAIFIPVLYLNFILSFLSIRKKWLIFITFIVGLFLAFLSTTPLFKIGIVNKFGFFWINPGPYYLLFPAFFIVCVLLSLAFLFNSYWKHKTDKRLRAQIRLQIIAGAIGFSGGITNFLPQFFNIFPFGNYFVLLYIFFISYSIIKYKFFDLKTAATELFAGGVVILFFFNLLTSVTLQDWLIRALLLALVSFFSILIVRGVSKEVRAREQIELLAGDLKKANDRLQFLDKQKSEFVSIASHQLRSPLTAIKGYTSMVLEGSFGFIEPKTREAVERIFQSAQNLVGIVDDLLNITRLEQGRMEYSFEKVDLSALTKEIVDSLYPNALNKKLGLTFENDNAQDYFVNADLLKIRQVVLNLVDNAIKYTKEGAVKVNVSRDSVKKIIKVMVTDSGVGITPELRTRLFEKFSRGDDVSKLHANGTGLGLYIAKQMIEAHKGSIGVNSEGEGKGSTFYIELPALN